MLTISEKLELFRAYYEKDENLITKIKTACPTLHNVHGNTIVPVFYKELNKSLLGLRDRFSKMDMNSLLFLLYNVSDHISLMWGKFFRNSLAPNTKNQCIDLIFVALAKCKNKTSIMMDTPIEQLFQKLYITPNNTCLSVDDIVEYFMSNPADDNTDPLGNGKLWKVGADATVKKLILSNPSLDPEAVKSWKKYRSDMNKIALKTLKHVTPVFLKAFDLLGKLAFILIKLIGEDGAKVAEQCMYNFNSFLEKNLSSREAQLIYNFKSGQKTVKNIFDQIDTCLHEKGRELQSIYNKMYKILKPSFPNVSNSDRNKLRVFILEFEKINII
jgi:hypothetical protein